MWAKFSPLTEYLFGNSQLDTDTDFNKIRSQKKKSKIVTSAEERMVLSGPIRSALVREVFPGEGAVELSSAK